MPRFCASLSSAESWLDVRRDVGNRDDEPPAAAHFLAVDRIVEIAGVLAVDRHERQLAQILAPALRRCGHGATEGLGLGHRVAWELERQTVRMDRDLGLHARRGMLTEHARHVAERLRCT